MKNLSSRYLPFDVLRGLTVALMIVANTPGNGATTYAPLLHSPWHGFTLTDLIFPTFMFVVGNALSVTLEKYSAMGNAAALRKILQRTLIIFILGYLICWFPFFLQNEAGEYFPWPISETRIPGVLQRIALGYGCAALILHYWKARGAAIFSVLALFGYWFLMYHFGDYTLQGNAVLKLDRFVFGDSHLYHGEGVAFDPEGILSTLPAIVNVIAGYFAGRFIRRDGSSLGTLAKLAVAGVLCILVALCWNPFFPINKKLWTSSYVLLSFGLDLLILSTLAHAIDMCRWRHWTYFFEVFGRNTLFIYALAEIGATTLSYIRLGDTNLYSWIYASLFRSWAGDYNGSLLFAVSWMLACWGVGYLLDKRKIYIKV
jgi:predicted acyltransferase